MASRDLPARRGEEPRPLPAAARAAEPRPMSPLPVIVKLVLLIVAAALLSALGAIVAYRRLDRELF